MILYVNGDSHTAAAEAVNQHAFAEDDPRLGHLHRLPHPANLAVSWGRRMADNLKCTFKCDAESAASNARILRTSRVWLDQHQHERSRIFMIIQWSTWEREEWLIDGIQYQIGGSGIDHVPVNHQARYRSWIADLDWDNAERYWHREIWSWHLELQGQGVSHIFFNGNNYFSRVPESARYDWGTSYIRPYDADGTYDQWLRRNGHDTVSPRSWHFGEAAHGAWSRFMLQYIVDNKLI
jgi:hypothetical protein